MKCRLASQKPFDVFRIHKADVEEDDLVEAFKDTHNHPIETRVQDLIKNTEKRHGFQHGQQLIRLSTLY
jgi:hypothetical protein